jgi:hypothetical protein
LGTEQPNQNGNGALPHKPAAKTSDRELLGFVIANPLAAAEELRRLRNIQSTYLELIIGFRTLFANVLAVIDEAIGSESERSS